jgi:hypothetical protein
MQRIAFYIVIALSVAAGTASAGARTAPALRLLDRTPLSVGGEHFAPRERVLVTVRGEVAAARTVRTGTAGTFVATFRDVAASRCDMLRVVAIGGAGRRAQLKLLPPPMCMPE